MRVLFLLFVIALSIRIIVVSLLPQDAPDTYRYDSIAVNLLSGGGFSTDGVNPRSDTAPLYPLMLALNYLLFGHNLLVVRILQAIIDSITCLLLYAIGIELSNKRMIGILSVTLACFSPTLIGSTSFVLTETLNGFLITAAVLLLMKAVKGNNGLYFLSGILLGISTLCRPTTLLFPIFLFASLVLSPKKAFQKVGITKKYIILSIIIFSFAMGITIIPWTVRNYFAFGRFLPVASGSGANLWIGSYLPWDGDYNYKDLSAKLKIEYGLSQIDADKRFKEEAIKNIKGHPFRYAVLCVKKLFRFWFGVPGSKEVLKDLILIKFLLYAIQSIVVFFFVLGIWFLIKDWDIVKAVPVTMIFYFTIMHSLLFAIPRYRIPIDPLILTIASIGIWHLTTLTTSFSYHFVLKKSLMSDNKFPLIRLLKKRFIIKTGRK